MSHLFPFIVGRPAYDLTLTQTRSLGAALGELDAALSRLRLDSAGRRLSFEHLSDVHSEVADPLEVPRTLDALPAEQRSRLEAILRHLLDITSNYYARLPRQIVHRDVDGSNVLMEGDRVTGIIDFEVAARDLRALELAAPLMQLTRNVREMLPEWEPIRRSQSDTVPGSISFNLFQEQDRRMPNYWDPPTRAQVSSETLYLRRRAHRPAD